MNNNCANKTMCIKVWYLFVFAILTLARAKYSKPTVYQKIRQSPKLSQFFSLLEANRPAKLNLQYGEITVFVPTNEAFDWFSGGNRQDVINYHMAWYAKQVKDLADGPLSTVIDENPFLWVTKLEDDTFINNARIVPEASDYVSEINNMPKKPQVLHVIDEVLDPVVKRTAIFNPSAFDFLAYPQFWDVGEHKTELFNRKLVGTRREALFKAEGNFTFFVPVDQGFTDYRLQIFDANAIEGHVVPDRVLFTRPTPKDTPFETIAQGESMHVVIMLSGAEGHLFAKSHTLIGDSNHPPGEIIAEIVKANIPVRNGVIHLIKRPLVVFDRRITLFPYLPVMDKVSMDPTLNLTYDLGERSGFNGILHDERKRFTFFVPRDRAWGNLQAFLEVDKTFFDAFVLKYGTAILSRHVVVSNVAYTIEDLRKRSNVSDTADVDLSTLGGVLKVGIGGSDGSYMIYWRNKIIKVYRADYQCTNGIIHIVDDLFVNEEDLDVVNADGDESKDVNPLKMLNMIIRLTI